MVSHIHLDKSHKPEDKDVLFALGESSVLWHDIHQYILQNYDFIPEMKFFTKKYGWMLRYINRKKTMCCFFPKKDCFSILIILGGKEAEQVILIKNRLNKKIMDVFDNTEQLHDGRWLWLEVKTSDDISSFKELLAIKRKPLQAKIKE
jgi:AraC family transcriptional regulator